MKPIFLFPNLKNLIIHFSPQHSTELAESYFYHFRLANNSIYRDYAWELAQSIYRSARTPEGKYLQIIDLKPKTERPRSSRSLAENRPPYFMGAMLKYLYLIFEDENVLPLDKWVFNAFGSPLPVCGQDDSGFDC